MDNNAYTVQTLAERWACSKDVIYDLLRKKELNAFRVGKALRISAAEVRRIEETPYEVQPRVTV